MLYALHTGRGGLNGSLSGTPGGPVFPAQQHLALRIRAPLRSLPSEWTCAAAGHAEWSIITNYVVPVPGAAHMYTNTSAHTHLSTHTKAAHVDEPSPFHLSLSLSYLYSGFVSPNWS